MAPRWREKRWQEKQLLSYLVPHVQHFLGVSIERHKLVWVFDPYWHATAGFLHLISLHPLNTHKARVRQKNQSSCPPLWLTPEIWANWPPMEVSKPMQRCSLFLGLLRVSLSPKTEMGNKWPGCQRKPPDQQSAIKSAGEWGSEPWQPMWQTGSHLNFSIIWLTDFQFYLLI